MIVSCSASQINGTVKAVSSKSYAHRAMICNALAGGKIDLNSTPSADIEATIKCLTALNATDKVKVLDAGESGSTLRFMLPVAAALGGEYEFVGRGKLMSRPSGELLFALSSHGIKVSTDKTKRLSGKLSSGRYEIRGDISSQYITGLLLALPLLKGDSEIFLTTPLSSKPYIDITLEVLKDFGINVVATSTGFKIKGNQEYIRQDGYRAEGDWSNSAFMLVAGAISGEATVTGLNLNSNQGDKVIVEILKSSGANVQTGSGSVTVKTGKLKAFSFDAENCPDVVPIASVLAANSEGISVVKNIKRLEIKESNRVEAVLSMLSAVGIKAERFADDLHITGGKICGGEINAYNDHRMAMSGAILALNAKETVKIIGAEAVNKSYPKFFEDYVKIGGKCENEF